ncbi:MAG TPA: glycosyltransferase family 2 protein [Bacteroidales bacterium]|nr:glycosyltransferase family 2 protein [Bacteroidales bacterium]
MKTSIIICTYNEEKTIADVLISCCRLNPDCEIIVVDDGSSDNTVNILNELSKEYTFRYEKLEKNMGKSWAMAHGVELSENEIILFFDADVSNLREEHFNEILKPIIENTADMVLGQPSETLIDYRINPFKVLTGERALLRKDLIPVLDEIRDIRFGVETFLNLYYQANGKRIKYVLMKGLKHPSTFEKSGSFGVAALKYLKEGNEIARTITSNYELINQRVELLLTSADKNAKNKIGALQEDINNRLQDLKGKLNI